MACLFSTEAILFYKNKNENEIISNLFYQGQFFLERKKRSNYG